MGPRDDRAGASARTAFAEAICPEQPARRAAGAPRGPPRGSVMHRCAGRARCPRASARRHAGGPPRRRGSAPGRSPAAERLCSSRTKRSTARPRSASAIPGPPSATVSRIRSPSPCARHHDLGRRAVAPSRRGAAYLMALSTRLASAWLTSSRLPCTVAAAGASTLSVSPRRRPAARRVRRRRARSRRRRSRSCCRGAWPDSARAIISSALKVRISPSDSSIVVFERGAVLRFVLGQCAAPPRQRLRSRVSGVLRSCAMLSETSLRPCISASMRSSMALRLSASRSSSSPVPAIGSRPDRSPAMMVRVVSVMASTRLSTRRVDEEAAGDAQHDHDRERPAAGRQHDVVQPLALLEIAADQQPEAAGQLEHPHQRVVLGGVRVVEPAVDGLGPAGRVENARSASEPTLPASPSPAERGDQIEARPRPARARVDRRRPAAGCRRAGTARRGR